MVIRRAVMTMSKNWRLTIAWIVLIVSGLWFLILGLYIIDRLNRWVGDIAEDDENLPPDVKTDSSWRYL